MTVRDGRGWNRTRRVTRFIIFLCKFYNAYNRNNSLTGKRHFGGVKGSTPFYFFAVRR